jgi:hypothetical protein
VGGLSTFKHIRARELGDMAWMMGRMRGGGGLVGVRGFKRRRGGWYFGSRVNRGLILLCFI